MSLLRTVAKTTYTQLNFWFCLLISHKKTTAKTELQEMVKKAGKNIIIMDISSVYFLFDQSKDVSFLQGDMVF